MQLAKPDLVLAINGSGMPYACGISSALRRLIVASAGAAVGVTIETQKETYHDYA